MPFINLSSINFKKLIPASILIFIGLLFLVPLIHTVINSITERDLSAGIFSAENFSIHQYISALSLNSWFLVFIKNSVILVLPIVIGQTVIALPAAYAFSRLRSKLFDSIFFLYVIILMMPFLVTLVPNYIIIEKLGLLGKYSSVILPGVFGAFGVFLLKQFMQHIPAEYLEAAEIMGASQLTILVRIVMPLMKNGIAALIVLLFIDNWNMVEQPLIFLQDMSKFPASIFLASDDILQQDGVFAAAVLSTIPAVMLFSVFEKYLYQGINMFAEGQSAAEASRTKNRGNLRI
jgi:multiple sugar transport system permease protein